MILLLACFFQSLFSSAAQPDYSNSDFSAAVRPKIMALVDEIERVYNHPAASAQSDSGCTLTPKERSLQAAHFAQQEQPEATALVVATLLHNLQHLLILEHRDDYARMVGRLIGDVWGDEVALPILHSVVAKRFLAAIDPGYVAHLSIPEQQLLIEQGGALAQDSAEYIALRRDPHFERTLAVRRWNDRATFMLTHSLDFAEFKPLLIETAYSHLRLHYHQNELPKVLTLLDDSLNSLCRHENPGH